MPNAHATGAQNVALNLGGYMPFSQVTPSPALETKVMFPADTASAAKANLTYSEYGFSGRLERAPHNNVHDQVGGWMSHTWTAAVDPIFFVHHCQVDRLYASWEAQSGASYDWGNSDAEPDEQTWKTRTALFVDENGRLVKVRLRDVMHQPGSRSGFAGCGFARRRCSRAAKNGLRAFHSSAGTGGGKTGSSGPPTGSSAPFVVLTAMQSVSSSVKSGGSSTTLAPDLNAAPSGAGSGGSTILILDGIKLMHYPPAPLSVFINLPSGTGPDLNGPYYAGTLSLPLRTRDR